MAILAVALEGRILAGRYRLISQLGRGGMGAVWRAEHIDLGTPAAVKLIDESFAQSPEALTRFRREAQSAASLRSTNVVQILDYGIDGDTPFIAMELLEGESLADRMERQYKLEPVDCATILLQVSKALSRAHDLGIVHRDLKPDNIFLVRDGEDEVTKVLDFGIAKRTSAFQTSADMATRTGSLMGTPYYMSPEQASGRRQVDHRTDIWAFAVIAYECLTGQRPFDDTNLGGLLLSICTENARVPSTVTTVPFGFDDWFARCTGKDPATRYGSIREAATDLCRLCGVHVPASRLASLSREAMVGAPDGAVQSVTSPWQEPGARVSMVTPGGVVKSPLSIQGQGTLARTPKRRSALFIVSGLVAGLGLLSALTATAWRFWGASATTGAVQVSSAERVVAAALPASSVAPPTPPPLSAAPASATAQATTVLSASAVPAVIAAPRRARSVTPAVRQPTTAVKPTETPRLRPQDRLERDLGF